MDRCSRRIDLALHYRHHDSSPVLYKFRKDASLYRWMIIDGCAPTLRSSAWHVSRLRARRASSNN